MKKQKKKPVAKKQFAGDTLRQDLSLPLDIFTCLLFCLFPLMVRNYTNLTATKYVTFLALGILLVITVVLAFLLVALDGNPWKRFVRPRLLSPDSFLALFLVSGVLSFLLSPYKSLRNASGDSVFLFGSGRYDGFLTLLLYAAVFWIVSRFGEMKKHHTLIVAVTTILMCLVGVIQLFGVNIFHLYANYLGGVTKFISTVGNTGMLSGLFCVFIPIIVVTYVLQEQKRRSAALFLAAEFLSVYVLFEIGVTAGKVALLAMLAVMIPFMLRTVDGAKKLLDVAAVFSASLACAVLFKCTFVARLSFTRITLRPCGEMFALLGFAVAFVVARLLLSRTTRIRTVRIVVIVALVALTLFMVFVNFTVDSVAENNQSGKSSRDELAQDVQNVVQGEATDSSGSYRFGIWSNALELGMERPVFGTGIGTFRKTFEDHIKGTALAKRLNTVDVAHNEYLHLFCTVGIVGLLTYLGFLITLAVKAFKHTDNPRVLILGAAVLSYCAQAFFSFNIVIITPLLWLCAGLLYAEIRKTERDPQ